MSQISDYALLFVLAGLTAVAVKFLANLGRFYDSGLIAMLPIKTIIAFVVLYREAGLRGVDGALPGAWAGALALLALLGSLWWLLRAASPLTALGIATLVWVATVYILRRLNVG